MITPSFGLTATERVLPKLALDFTTASLDSRITFTRTTGASNPATYVNSSGVVTAATNNQPRFDYDPVTLACKGLLIEESRQNLLTYSDDFGNAIWNPQSATVSANVIVSPDGTTNGDKLVSANAPAIIPRLRRLNTLSNTTQTVSIYAKKAEWNYLAISQDGARPVVYNLNTGVVESQVTSTGAIYDAGNGWFRCVYMYTSTASNPIALTISTQNTAAFGTVLGDGVSGVYIWGAQLEAGAFATSYIPTTTTALTRNADVATMTGTNFSDWFNASEGSFVVDAAYRAVPTVDKAILFISDGTANNQIQIYASATGITRFYMVTGGATQVSSVTSGGVIQANTYIKQCCSYKQNDSVFGYNANLNAVDTSCTVPTVDRLYVSFAANAWIKSLNYYPQRLTNNETKSFTKA